MPSEAQVQAQTELPSNFAPSVADVMCGKGKACYNHSGNQAFRFLVETNLPRYISATTRIEKGLIVNEIAQVICSNARNGGGFIRLDHDTGLWFEVGHEAAKQKVAQTIREMAMKTNPEKEARKQKKRAISRALRLAAKKQATSYVSISVSSAQASHDGSETLAANTRTSPESILGTLPPPLVYQSSRDWFYDSDLSETSVIGPGEELDDTFFDHYALYQGPPTHNQAVTLSGGENFTMGLDPTQPPALMLQSSVEFFTTSATPTLSFQSSTDSFEVPTSLKLQTSIGIFSVGPSSHHLDMLTERGSRISVLFNENFFVFFIVSVDG
jgi:hypothetical protein